MEEDTAGHRESPPIKVHRNRTDCRLIRQSKVSAPRQFASRPRPTQKLQDSADDPMPPSYPLAWSGVCQQSKTEVSKSRKHALLATLCTTLRLKQKNLKLPKRTCRRSLNRDPMMAASSKSGARSDKNHLRVNGKQN